MVFDGDDDPRHNFTLTRVGLCQKLGAKGVTVYKHTTRTRSRYVKYNKYVPGRNKRRDRNGVYLYC